jgi:MFS transporter, PPP family, 3-phenylpropionic acid transporter
VTTKSSAGGPSPTAVILSSGLAYALFFGAVGAWSPYAPVYFRELGVDLAGIGLLAAVPAAVAIVVAPAWGLLADRLGDVRAPLLASSALAVVVALLLATEPPMWALLPGVGLLAAGTSAMAPLVDARTISGLGAQRDRYGQARVLGSVGFIVATIATGILIDAFGTRALFGAYIPLIACGVVAVGLTFGGPGTRSRVGGVGPSGALGLLRYPPFGVYFLGSVLFWTACNGATAYFSIRLVQQGGDAGLVGIGWAVNALVEIPTMLVFRRLAGRVGVPALLTAGAAMIGVRNVGWALAGSAEASVAVAALSGIGFSLFLVGTTSWLADRVPGAMRATAQALFLGTAYAIGTIGGSLGAGAMAATGGLQGMFAVLGAVALGAAAIVWIAVGRPVPGRAGAPGMPGAGGAR